jgi:hypothetical protein
MLREQQGSLPTPEDIHRMKENLLAAQAREEARHKIEEKAAENPELHFDDVILYHGSPVPDIKDLEAATEDTVGRGVYLLNNSEQAAQYARKRALERDSLAPVVYEARLKNLRLVNLDNPEKLGEIMEGFAQELEKLKKTGGLAWNVLEAADRAIALIRGGRIVPGNVKHAVWNFNSQFSTYLVGLGYDGLKTWEGGEGEEISSHETYLVFDPKRIISLDYQPTSSQPRTQ